MKTKERRERLQNKGFTLIELIVTIAIIAIFSGVVLTFISTGSNTYRSTSSSAKVQMETQETFDQIEDLIIDVNRSLYYANGSGDSLGAEIKTYIKQSGGANSTGDKTFIICNEYKNGTGNSSISVMFLTGIRTMQQSITARKSTKQPAALQEMRLL